MENNIHHLADVKTTKIGANTTIWQFCVIFEKAVIGENCNICSHSLIENDVVIGNNVTVKSGVQIWDGTTIEDGVFIGPNVTFTNDLFPKSKNTNWVKLSTKIGANASIGANATLLAGIEIGNHSMVGAGSVLTKSTAPFTLWYGNPATQKGYITKSGVVLNNELIDVKTGQQYKLTNVDLILVP